MGETYTLDWWLHQIYRQTKEFLMNPSKEREHQLVSLIAEYRRRHEEHGLAENADEHEHLMDFR